MQAKSAMRLFNSLDPSPLEGRDLDDGIAEYIAGAAREFRQRTPLKLVLYLPQEEINKSTRESLVKAVHNYFAYRAEVAGRDLRELMRRGRRSLLIGVAFLFACITARAFVLESFDVSTWREILAEGLLISGWVAMWRPIQIFLYDWWPIRRLILVWRKLSEVEVEVEAVPGGGG
jgi:hypothetical protein